MSSDWRGYTFRNKSYWFGMNFNPKLLPGERLCFGRIKFEAEAIPSSSKCRAVSIFKTHVHLVALSVFIFVSYFLTEKKN